MKKTYFLMTVIAVSFCFGFAFKTIITPKPTVETEMKRVTGIGGIFFKCKNPAQMREWYHTHLGLEVNKYGSVFEWRQGADTTQKGFTQWSPFSEKTKYFDPSTKDYMINYRVQNLTALVALLQKEGVTITDSIETASYGKFVHILDMEGNKVELWEPNDIEYEKMGIQMGMRTTK